ASVRNNSNHHSERKRASRSPSTAPLSEFSGPMRNYWAPLGIQCSRRGHPVGVPGKSSPGVTRRRSAAGQNWDRLNLREDLFPMIEVRGLTKRYGAKTAVDNLTFSIESGQVTGFLGPNGAGKTTTMRCILGLDYPDAGTVTVDGQVDADLAHTMRDIGPLLEAKAVHGGRSAYNHLLC